MCEYCDIAEWEKENPPPPVPDGLWNVRFLDIKRAQSPCPKGYQKKRHYDRRFIDVRLTAANQFIAERLAWDLLQEKIGTVPFKDEYVLMGSSEIKNGQ